MASGYTLNIKKLEEIYSWLLSGDISIQYQTERDLLKRDNSSLRDQIPFEGWAKTLLSKQHKNHHWGQGFYHPKWISTHYTLLDLRNLCCPPTEGIQKAISKIIDEELKPDGGIGPGKTIPSDVCVNGMFLNYASYFNTDEFLLRSIIDFILHQTLPDGGFNCYLNSIGAKHSSLHSTLSVLEGIYEYEKNNYRYRIEELCVAKRNSFEFILEHYLFKSDKTGKIINPSFLKFPYPSRWKYDILRALDFFQYSETPFDKRMIDAIEVLHKKKNKNGYWLQYAQYPGKVHFIMEESGNPGRWNTLRALRVLNFYRDFIKSF